MYLAIKLQVIIKTRQKNILTRFDFVFSSTHFSFNKNIKRKCVQDNNNNNHNILLFFDTKFYYIVHYIIEINI